MFGRARCGVNFRAFPATETELRHGGGQRLRGGMVRDRFHETRHGGARVRNIALLSEPVAVQGNAREAARFLPAPFSGPVRDPSPQDPNDLSGGDGNGWREPERKCINTERNRAASGHGSAAGLTPETGAT